MRFEGPCCDVKRSGTSAWAGCPVFLHVLFLGLSLLRYCSRHSTPTQAAHDRCMFSLFCFHVFDAKQSLQRRLAVWSLSRKQA